MMKRMLAEHRCQQLEDKVPVYYGPAVTHIYYGVERDMYEEMSGPDIEAWWMGNGEYGSGPIVACPFCGERLEKPKR
jgi:hypothetical protein